jgi:hypothetical protein
MCRTQNSYSRIKDKPLVSKHLHSIWHGYPGASPKSGLPNKSSLRRLRVAVRELIRTRIKLPSLKSPLKINPEIKLTNPQLQRLERHGLPKSERLFHSRLDHSPCRKTRNRENQHRVCPQEGIRLRTKLLIIALQTQLTSY